MGTGIFLHAACISNLNYRLVAFSMMEHLQLFLMVLKVEARFPAGTMMNDTHTKKKSVTIGGAISHLGERGIWTVLYCGTFSQRKY